VAHLRLACGGKRPGLGIVSLVGPTPVPQFDWLAAFRFAWAVPDFNLPRDEFDP